MMYSLIPSLILKLFKDTSGIMYRGCLYDYIINEHINSLINMHDIQYFESMDLSNKLIKLWNIKSL